MKRVFAVLAVLAFTACRDAVEPGVSGSPLFSHVSSASWMPIASMGSQRYGGMGATGADGRIYVFGGSNPSGTPAGAEAYDPSTDSWSAIADAGSIFLAGVARGGDDRIYIAGGLVGGAYLADVRAYDAASDTYAAVASMSVGRYAPMSAAGADGKVYVVGGLTPGDVATSSGEVYDPATGTWSPIASMSVARFAGAAATGSDGRIYVFAGLDETFTATSSVEAYDPTEKGWSSVASMPAALEAPAAVAGADGHIYVFGGFDGAAFSAATFAYEPSTDTWTTVASLSVPRYAPAAAGGLDGRVYALGGYDGIDFVSSAEVLATSTPDTHAPTISMVVSPTQLWPPNRKMVLVATGISATDDRDFAPVLAVSVTSSEPVSGEGYGETAPDWEVVSNEDGTFDVSVRAERSGIGPGRVYTITATATDAAGNKAIETATVTVPKSKGS